MIDQHQHDHKALHTLRIAISVITNIGILLAILLVIIGGVLYLSQHGQEPFASAINTPLVKGNLYNDWQALRHLSANAMIELGLATLITTQVLRVVVTAWLFMQQKDYLFLGFTVFILFIIAISLFK